MAERAEVASRENLVPMGLTHGAEVLCDIPEDGMINYDNIRVEDSFAFRLLRGETV